MNFTLLLFALNFLAKSSVLKALLSHHTELLGEKFSAYAGLAFID